MSKFWLFSVGILLSGIACAEDTAQPQTEATESKDIKVPSPWEGQVELGYQAHSGNTNTEALNTLLQASYTEGRHRTTGQWKLYKLVRETYKDKRKSDYSLQSDYKLGPKHYLYSSFKGTDSNYTAYFKDYTFSAGLGYQLMHTEKVTWEFELGPGYRYQEPNVDEIDSNDVVFDETIQEPIIRFNVRNEWVIRKNLNFYADVTVVTGDSNTTYTSDVGLTNNITDNIALKLSHNLQYYDKVPDGLVKHDGIFTVSVLVSF
ncbi:DUF481 domain-containing protein [Vibrio porteresiae]|uniref:DUF481 domain-containing protein n=1 Tax=Vibrio porteresiae DSM 19223 TaxID=1123496 RepID=A0ABZ0QD57_9VIBR|nr:DUF481 domain-containing protein [Vibrio porteresiae]WPC74409.1 DUF481 domain-containing protein [Vibrio porteresiae DSM 19223]